MANSPQQAFIKRTRGDVTRAENGIVKFRADIKKMQKGSIGAKFTGIPSVELIQIQNLYLDTGKEGRLIVSALQRLDSAWDLSTEKFRLAPGAIKVRASHERLRTTYESLLRGISDELDRRP